MSRKRYHLSNWKEYNRKLEERGSIEIWFDQEVLKQWNAVPKKKGKKAGRPKEYGEAAIKCALIFKYLYRLAFRQMQRFVSDLVKALNLEVKVHDYSTVCKRQNEVKIELIKKYKNSRKLYVLVDSSGLKVFGEGEWKVRMHGVGKRRTWIKLHIGVGITNDNKKRIEVVEVTKSGGHDCTMLSKLLNGVSGKIDNVIGDGAYDGKGCYQVTMERGAKLIAPPRVTAKMKFVQGLTSPPIAASNKTVWYVRHRGMERWKEKTNYHKRSLVENTFFRLKTIFGDRLNAHKFVNQKIEALLKFEILNRLSERGMPKSYAIQNAV